MVQITHSVGKAGINDKADVAVIQTALKNLQQQTKFGRKPLYGGRIDGRNSRDLESAIAAFQAGQSLKPGGKLIPHSPDLRAVRKA